MTKLGNHNRLLAAAIERGMIQVVPGSINRLEVLHDNDCSCLRSGGRKRCRCEPILRLGT